MTWTSSSLTFSPSKTNQIFPSSVRRVGKRGRKKKIKKTEAKSPAVFSLPIDLYTVVQGHPVRLSDL